MRECQWFWRKTRPPRTETSVEGEATPGPHGGVSRTCASAQWLGREVLGVGTVRHALTASPVPVTAFPTEAAEQPEHPRAAGLAPSLLRPRPELHRDGMRLVPAGSGGEGQAEPSAQAAPSPPRRQTPSPSLRSTSPLLLPQGSRVQVQVRPGRGGLGKGVEGEICQVAALGSLSWGSVDPLPCKGAGTDAGISRVWDTVCSSPSVCPPGSSLNSGL